MPWPEDDGLNLNLETRGTSMREPSNDYIRHPKTFSMLLSRSSYAHQIAILLDFLTPLRPEEHLPK